MRAHFINSCIGKNGRVFNLTGMLCFDDLNAQSWADDRSVVNVRGSLMMGLALDVPFSRIYS